MTFKLLKLLMAAGFIALASPVQAQTEGSAAKKPAAGIIYLADYQAGGARTGHSPFDNAVVDGVFFRTGWSDTEPQDNAYDWAQIDRYLEGAKRSGKILGLAIGAGRGTPQWFLRSPGAITFAMNVGAGPGRRREGPRREIIMPVPWDRAFQDKWGEFLQAVAARYDAEPNLGYVAIAGMGNGFEPIMARSPEDVRTFEAMGGLPRWIEGSKAVIDLYAKHFRKTPFILAMHLPVQSREAWGAIEAVVDYGLRTYPGRFGVKYNGLNAGASTGDLYDRVISEWSSRSPVAYQMIWASVGANAHWLRGSLGEALRRGVANKAHFVEVYAVDCENLQYAADLKQAGAALRANASAFRR